MPPRTKLDADPAEPTPDAPAEDATTVDETPATEPADDEPAVEPEPATAEPAVTHVRATSAFTVSYGQRLITLAEGDEAHADLAVFLAAAGVPVEPVED